MGMTKEELLDAVQNLKSGDLIFDDIEIKVDLDVARVVDGEKSAGTIGEDAANLSGTIRGMALARACQERHSDVCSFIHEAINEKLERDGYAVLDPEFCNPATAIEKEKKGKEFCENLNKKREEALNPTAAGGCRHTPPCSEKKQQILDAIAGIKQGDFPTDLTPELMAIVAMSVLAGRR